MTAETLRHAAIMLAAGIGVPILAALNARLGTHLGAPVTAAFCLFGVAFLATGAVALITAPGGIAQLPSAPKHLFLAGTLIAFYVLSITWIAPKFGVGNAVFFVLLGQLISAALIDHFGLFGARPSPVSWSRVAGIALMASGVLLAQKT